jgi:hypothetical protein
MEIEGSSPIREYVRERQGGDSCVYCGSQEQLTLEHILQRGHRGPDVADVLGAWSGFEMIDWLKKARKKLQIRHRLRAVAALADRVLGSTCPEI